jgi:hypothetical protein
MADERRRGINTILGERLDQVDAPAGRVCFGTELQIRGTFLQAEAAMDALAHIGVCRPIDDLAV